MFLRIPNNPKDPSEHFFELPLHFEEFVYGGYFSHSSHVKDCYSLIYGIIF